MLHSFNGIYPQVHESVFLAPGVQIIGDVVIEEGASIWYNTVLRGDLAPIRIGRNSNVQDGCIGHVNVNQPLLVERYTAKNERYRRVKAAARPCIHQVLL